MAKTTKKHYYVLVFTEHGAVYVTGVPQHNWAEWKDTEKPMEFSRGYAEDVVLGLNLNMHSAVVVTSNWEITSQPYRYNAGQFIWHDYESEEEHND